MVVGVVSQGGVESRSRLPALSNGIASAPAITPRQLAPPPKLGGIPSFIALSKSTPSSSSSSSTATTTQPASTKPPTGLPSRLGRPSPAVKRHPQSPQSPLPSITTASQGVNKQLPTKLASFRDTSSNGNSPRGGSGEFEQQIAAAPSETVSAVVQRVQQQKVGGGEKVNGAIGGGGSAHRPQQQQPITTPPIPPQRQLPSTATTQPLHPPQQQQQRTGSRLKAPLPVVLTSRRNSRSREPPPPLSSSSSSAAASPSRLPVSAGGAAGANATVATSCLSSLNSSSAFTASTSSTITTTSSSTTSMSLLPQPSSSSAAANHHDGGGGGGGMGGGGEAPAGTLGGSRIAKKSTLGRIPTPAGASGRTVLSPPQTKPIATVAVTAVDAATTSAATTTPSAAGQEGRRSRRNIEDVQSGGGEVSSNVAAANVVDSCRVEEKKERSLASRVQLPLPSIPSHTPHYGFASAAFRPPSAAVAASADRLPPQPSTTVAKKPSRTEQKSRIATAAFEAAKKKEEEASTTSNNSSSARRQLQLPTATLNSSSPSGVNATAVANSFSDVTESATTSSSNSRKSSIGAVAPLSSTTSTSSSTTPSSTTSLSSPVAVSTAGRAAPNSTTTTTNSSSSTPSSPSSLSEEDASLRSFALVAQGSGDKEGKRGKVGNPQEGVAQQKPGTFPAAERREGSPSMEQSKMPPLAIVKGSVSLVGYSSSATVTTTHQPPPSTAIPPPPPSPFSATSHKHHLRQQPPPPPSNGGGSSRSNSSGIPTTAPPTHTSSSPSKQPPPSAASSSSLSTMPCGTPSKKMTVAAFAGRLASGVEKASHQPQQGCYAAMASNSSTIAVGVVSPMPKQQQSGNGKKMATTGPATATSASSPEGGNNREHYSSSPQLPPPMGPIGHGNIAGGGSSGTQKRLEGEGDLKMDGEEDRIGEIEGDHAQRRPSTTVSAAERRQDGWSSPAGVGKGSLERRRRRNKGVMLDHPRYHSYLLRQQSGGSSNGGQIELQSCNGKRSDKCQGTTGSPQQPYRSLQSPYRTRQALFGQAGGGAQLGDHHRYYHSSELSRAGGISSSSSSSSSLSTATSLSPSSSTSLSTTASATGANDGHIMADGGMEDCGNNGYAHVTRGGVVPSPSHCPPAAQHQGGSRVCEEVIYRGQRERRMAAAINHQHHTGRNGDRKISLNEAPDAAHQNNTTTLVDSEYDLPAASPRHYYHTVNLGYPLLEQAEDNLMPVLRFGHHDTATPSGPTRVKVPPPPPPPPPQPLENFHYYDRNRQHQQEQYQRQQYGQQLPQRILSPVPREPGGDIDALYETSHLTSAIPKPTSTTGGGGPYKSHSLDRNRHLRVFQAQQPTNHQLHYGALPNHSHIQAVGGGADGLPRLSLSSSGRNGAVQESAAARNRQLRELQQQQEQWESGLRGREQSAQLSSFLVSPRHHYNALRQSRQAQQQFPYLGNGNGNNASRGIPALPSLLAFAAFLTNNSRNSPKSRRHPHHSTAAAMQLEGADHYYSSNSDEFYALLQQQQRQHSSRNQSTPQRHRSSSSAPRQDHFPPSSSSRGLLLHPPPSFELEEANRLRCVDVETSRVEDEDEGSWSRVGKGGGNSRNGLMSKSMVMLQRGATPRQQQSTAANGGNSTRNTTTNTNSSGGGGSTNSKRKAASPSYASIGRKGMGLLGNLNLAFSLAKQRQPDVDGKSDGDKQCVDDDEVLPSYRDRANGGVSGQGSHSARTPLVSLSRSSPPSTHMSIASSGVVAAGDYATNPTPPQLLALHKLSTSATTTAPTNHHHHHINGIGGMGPIDASNLPHPPATRRHTSISQGSLGDANGDEMSPYQNFSVYGAATRNTPSRVSQLSIPSTTATTAAAATAANCGGSSSSVGGGSTGGMLEGRYYEFEIHKLHCEMDSYRATISSLAAKQHDYGQLIQLFNNKLLLMLQHVERMQKKSQLKKDEIAQLNTQIENLRLLSIKAGVNIPVFPTAPNGGSIGHHHLPPPASAVAAKTASSTDKNSAKKATINSTTSDNTSQRSGNPSKKEKAQGNVDSRGEGRSEAEHGSGGDSNNGEKPSGKRYGWIRSSFSRAFHKANAAKKEGGCASDDKIPTIQHQLPGNSTPTTSGNLPPVNNGNGAAATTPRGKQPSGAVVEPAVTDKKDGELVALRRQLEDKDLALTDVRLDALDKAREVDMLRETVHRLKSENKLLKQNFTGLDRGNCNGAHSRDATDNNSLVSSHQSLSSATTSRSGAAGLLNGLGDNDSLLPTCYDDDEDDCEGHRANFSYRSKQPSSSASTGFNSSTGQTRQQSMLSNASSDEVPSLGYNSTTSGITSLHHTPRSAASPAMVGGREEMTAFAQSRETMVKVILCLDVSGRMATKGTTPHSATASSNFSSIGSSSSSSAQQLMMSKGNQRGSSSTISSTFSSTSSSNPHHHQTPPKKDGSYAFSSGGGKYPLLTIGFIPPPAANAAASGPTTWEELDQQLGMLLEEYLHTIDPDMTLGVDSYSCIIGYEIRSPVAPRSTMTQNDHSGKTAMGGGRDEVWQRSIPPATELQGGAAGADVWKLAGVLRREDTNGTLVPCHDGTPKEIVTDGSTIAMRLRGAAQDSLDVLVLESLFPRLLLERLLADLLHPPHRLLIHGASGMGKSKMAKQLARYLAAKFSIPPAEIIDVRLGNEEGDSALSTTAQQQLLIDALSTCGGGGGEIKTAVSASVGKSVAKLILIDNLREKCLPILSEAFQHADLIKSPLSSSTTDKIFVLCTLNRAGAASPHLQTLVHRHHFRTYGMAHGQSSNYSPSSNNDEDTSAPAGYMDRYLRRRLAEAELNGCLVEAEKQQLLLIFYFLGRVLARVNTMIEEAGQVGISDSSGGSGGGDLAIGPRVFLQCPLEVEASRQWFIELWNTKLIPYLAKVITTSSISRQKSPSAHDKEMMAMNYHHHDPTPYVCEQWPWRPSTLADEHHPGGRVGENLCTNPMSAVDAHQHPTHLLKRLSTNPPTIGHHHDSGAGTATNATLMSITEPLPPCSSSSTSSSSMTRRSTPSSASSSGGSGAHHLLLTHHHQCPSSLSSGYGSSLSSTTINTTVSTTATAIPALLAAANNYNYHSPLTGGNSGGGGSRITAAIKMPKKPKE